MRQDENQEKLEIGLSNERILIAILLDRQSRWSARALPGARLLFLRTASSICSHCSEQIHAMHIHSCQCLTVVREVCGVQS